jgi:hypothetical protein
MNCGSRVFLENTLRRNGLWLRRAVQNRAQIKERNPEHDVQTGSRKSPHDFLVVIVPRRFHLLSGCVTGRAKPATDGATQKVSGNTKGVSHRFHKFMLESYL